MHYKNILEEELKNKVAQDWFSDFDCSKIVGKIDFAITPKGKTVGAKNLSPTHEDHFLLWAEAKRGDYDVVEMFVQLIFTIKKENALGNHIPPAFLGAFDFKK